MSISKNTVLLLKSEKSDDDPYENLLRSRHFHVIQVKTLEFQYKNLPVLSEKLSNSSEYSGIIFSSPRCVNAVVQSIARESFKALWKSRSNFVVGEATFQTVREQLGVECQGKESGNARNLSQIIIKNKESYTKPFLFPHGNLKTDTLNEEIAKERLSLEGVLVYDTIPNPNIERELSLGTNDFTTIPEFVVFFSPSGVKASIQYLQRIPFDADLVKFIAIGPVTESAMLDFNLKVYNVAKSPTPEEVMKALA